MSDEMVRKIREPGLSIVVDEEGNATIETSEGNFPLGGNGGGPHTHDDYADEGHTHDETPHDHDEDYSGTGHNHDGTYADPHAHPFASDSHNHDADYSATGHGHTHNHDTEIDAALADHLINEQHGEGGGGVTLNEVIDALYPVGSLYTSTLSTNPGTLLGRGTWAAFGEGRVMVGRSASDADFDTAEETGGAKTHTLTAGEMPSHTHTQDAHTHTQNSHNHTQDAHNHTQNAHTHPQTVQSAATGGQSGPITDTSSNTPVNQTNATGSTTPTNNPATATNQAATAVNQNATPTNQNTGGGGAHNNLQPYIVVYMWKRTA